MGMTIKIIEPPGKNERFSVFTSSGICNSLGELHLGIFLPEEGPRVPLEDKRLLQILAGCQGLIPVIPATGEAEIRRITVRGQPEQTV
jgi:hypothetical protein